MECKILKQLVIGENAASYHKREIPVLVRSLKSSILSLTNSQMDQTIWGEVCAAVRRLELWYVHKDTLSHWPGA